MTKYLQTYWNGLRQLHISDDLGQGCKAHSPSTHIFNFLKPFHIVNSLKFYSLKKLLTLYLSATA